LARKSRTRIIWQPEKAKEASMVSATTTSPDDWLTAYAAALDGKAAGTVDAYLRALRQFLTWLAQRPGHGSGFAPEGQYEHCCNQTQSGNLLPVPISKTTHARTHNRQSCSCTEKPFIASLCSVSNHHLARRLSHEVVV
jgi:hypothetical protein